MRTLGKDQVSGTTGIFSYGKILVELRLVEWFAPPTSLLHLFGPQRPGTCLRLNDCRHSGVANHCFACIQQRSRRQGESKSERERMRDTDTGALASLQLLAAENFSEFPRRFALYSNFKGSNACTCIRNYSFVPLELSSFCRCT
jgi:hypothetical protein